LVVVVAVDHPFVRPQTLRAMVARTEELPVVPVDDHGTRQVTCAVYPSAIADAARQEADGGGSIQSLLDRVAFDPITPEVWESWGEDGRSWFSVDSQTALDDALARFS
jgi:molybdopterin-guanine dinucleotide biosynthesis protein A